jgi:hypothetical protein
MNLNWYEIEHPPDIPQWQRSAGIDTEGTVYVPASLTGDEPKAAFLALNCGITVILHLEHAFIPTTWLARECPPLRDLCAKIERRIREVNSEPPNKTNGRGEM